MEAESQPLLINASDKDGAGEGAAFAVEHAESEQRQQQQQPAAPLAVGKLQLSKAIRLYAIVTVAILGGILFGFEIRCARRWFCPECACGR